MDTKKFAKSKHRDKLRGGKADKLKPSDFDKKQLAQGTKHELEHTDDRALAQEIAMDHLSEDGDYYKKLKRVEKSASPKDFAKNFKKSYDWKDVQVTVPASDHSAAEQTIPPELIGRLRNEAVGDMSKISFAKGTLTLSKTAEGLFSGFFQDSQGQVVDRYEPTTLEIIAKNLIVKNLFNPELLTSSAEEKAPSPEVAHSDAQQDLRLIADVVSSVMTDHNNVYHQGQAPFEPIAGGKGSLKIKYGGFELELKKSVQDFVTSFKSDKISSKNEIRKALGMWRRNSAKQFGTDIEAAKALIQHWDTHSESFNQILFAIEQLKKK